MLGLVWNTIETRLIVNIEYNKLTILQRGSWAQSVMNRCSSGLNIYSRWSNIGRIRYTHLNEI